MANHDEARRNLATYARRVGFTLFADLVLTSDDGDELFEAISGDLQAGGLSAIQARDGIIGGGLLARITLLLDAKSEADLDLN